MMEFHSNAHQLLFEFKSKFDDLFHACDDVVEYLGEDPKDTNCVEVFNAILKFVVSWAKIEKEIELERQEVQKRIDRKAGLTMHRQRGR